jgi:mRNA-binding protein PUF3
MWHPGAPSQQNTASALAGGFNRRVTPFEDFSSESSTRAPSGCSTPNASSEARTSSFNVDTTKVVGNVWMLSRDAKGCHYVQEAIEQADSDETRQALAMELKGHVSEALECPHAHHVLQKCITTLRPHAMEFILSELQINREVTAVARHKFGCRVLMRLLEHCKENQMETLESFLTADAVDLCVHKYGNYVIQHLIEHGSDESRWALIAVLVRHASKLALDSTAVSVVNKTFEICCPEDCRRLALGLQSCQNLLLRLCRSRRGHQVVKAVLQHLPPGSSELQDVVSQVIGAKELLSASRYGRALVTLCKASYS